MPRAHCAIQRRYGYKTPICKVNERPSCPLQDIEGNVLSATDIRVGPAVLSTPMGCFATELSEGDRNSHHRHTDVISAGESTRIVAASLKAISLNLDLSTTASRHRRGIQTVPAFPIFKEGLHSSRVAKRYRRACFEEAQDRQPCFVRPLRLANKVHVTQDYSGRGGTRIPICKIAGVAAGGGIESKTIYQYGIAPFCCTPCPVVRCPSR